MEYNKYTTNEKVGIIKMKINKSFLIIFVLVLAVFLPSCKGGDDLLPVDSGIVEIPSTPGAASEEVTTADTTTTESMTTQPTPEPAPEAEHGTTPSHMPEGVAPTTSNYNAFTANSANAPDVENNITIKAAQSHYPVNETIIKLEITNLSGWMMIYADEYALEKSVNDTWEEVPTKNNVFNGAPMYELGTGRTGIATIDLNFLKEPLEIGQYRVSIICACNGHNGNFLKTAEFSVK